MDLLPQLGNSNWGPGWVTTLFLHFCIGKLSLHGYKSLFFLFALNKDRECSFELQVGLTVYEKNKTNNTFLSKKYELSNDQEPLQSEQKSCPRNQNEILNSPG